MIDYTTLEEAIVTALLPVKNAGVEVMAWPEKESEFARPLTKSRISVVYHSSDYGPLISADQSTQEETVAIQLLIEAINLRQPLGIYDLKAKALTCLLGLQVPNFDKIRAKSFDIAKRDAEAGGIYSYNLILVCKAISQQAIDDYEQNLADSLTELTDDYGGGDSTVVFPPQYPLEIP